MKTKLITTLAIFFLLACAVQAQAITTVYTRSGLIGGGAGDLDTIDAAGLNGGDLAFVSASNIFYIYILDASSGATESSPTIITPHGTPGNKRWVLHGVYAGSFTTAASDGSNYLQVANNTSLTCSSGNKIYPVANAWVMCENGTAKTPMYDTSAVTTTVGTSRSVAKAAEYVFCSSTCTVTPPTPVAGYQLCVMNAPGSATVITLAAITSTYYGKTDNSGWQANAAYKLVSGGAATDKICIVGYDSSHYIIMSSTGTWTHTAP